jgi:cell division protein FtsB
MDIVRGAKRAAQAMVPPVLFMALTAYFSWNAMRGEHGLRSYAIAQQQLITEQAKLAQAQAERDAWETRVSGLRANHIDPDTLDERARAMLNLADPNDIVVPYGQGNKLF